MVHTQKSAEQVNFGAIRTACVTSHKEGN